MPSVFRDGPFRFFFYSNEGNPREPLHVHVRGAGGEAKIALDPTPRVVRSRGLSSAILQTLTGIVAQNRTQIEEAWDDHFR